MIAIMSRPLLVVTTVGSADDARRIAQALVQQRLAACVQIDAIESVYRWQSAVESAAEWRLSCKTWPDRAAELMATLRAMHPYELPALHTLAMADADPVYAAWVRDSTRPA